MDGLPEGPLPAEELLLVDSSWERDCHFYFEMQLLVVCPCSTESKRTHGQMASTHWTQWVILKWRTWRWEGDVLGLGRVWEMSIVSTEVIKIVTYQDFCMREEYIFKKRKKAHHIYEWNFQTINKNICQKCVEGSVNKRAKWVKVAVAMSDELALIPMWKTILVCCSLISTSTHQSTHPYNPCPNTRKLIIVENFCI